MVLNEATKEASSAQPSSPINRGLSSLGPLECCSLSCGGFALQLQKKRHQQLFARSWCTPACVRGKGDFGGSPQCLPQPHHSVSGGFLSVPSDPWQFSGCCLLSGRGQDLRSSLTWRRSQRAFLSSFIWALLLFPSSQLKTQG